MKWSLFNWKKPAVSSGEPEDYQVVKNTVNQNTTNIRNLNNQVNVAQGAADRNEQSINNINNQLTNTVSTNTAQTITGTKTLSDTLTLTKTNGALAFKPGTNQPGFIEFYNSTTRIGYMGKASSTNNNIVIGSQFGDIVLETAANNGIVIPEPRVNNNPATKNYVDTKETAINNQITAINNRIVENNTILKRTYTFTPSSSTPLNPGNGEIYRYVLRITDLTNVSVIGISTNYQNQSNSNFKSQFWEVSYSLWNGGVNIQLTGDKKWYNYTQSSQTPINMNIDFTQFEITVFYMENANREVEQRYQGRIVPLDEIFGGK